MTRVAEKYGKQKMNLKLEVGCAKITFFFENEMPYEKGS
jgi:hypothetical protein